MKARHPTSLTVWTGVAALVVNAAACGSEDPPPAETSSEPVIEHVAESEDASEPPANATPVVRSVRFDPEAPAPGETVRAVVDATDAENDPLYFEYEWTLDGREAGNGSKELLLDGASKGESVEVRVVVSDGMSASRPAWARVDVRNRPPQIAGVSIEPGREIVTGTPVVLHPDATDPDGEGIRYRYVWTVNGRQRREEGPLLDTARLKRGDEIRASVFASDGDDETMAELPPIVVVNSPPRIVSRPPGRLDGGVFRYPVTVRDPDGDGRVDYRLEGAPEGMEIDAYSGVVTWKPGPDQTGVHQATVVAADAHDGVDQQVFEVHVDAPDDAPAGIAP